MSEYTAGGSAREHTARARRTRVIAAELATLVMGAGMLIVGLSVTASAAPGDPIAEGKVAVCKYVGTPGEDEELQTGQNPIVIAIAALPGNVTDPEIGDIFVDGQGFSIVVALAGDPEPSVEDCPGFEPPPSSTPPSSTPPTTVTTTVVTTTAPPTTPTETSPTPVTRPSGSVTPTPTSVVTPRSGPEAQTGITAGAVTSRPLLWLAFLGAGLMVAGLLGLMVTAPSGVRRS